MNYCIYTLLHFPQMLADMYVLKLDNINPIVTKSRDTANFDVQYSIATAVF